MKKKIIFFLFLYLTRIITSNPTVSASINVEDISIQKCFTAENTQSTEQTKVYQINNNSTSNTIFIQYKSLTNIIISDSIKDDSAIFKSSDNLGSFYLNMLPGKNNYYITITPKDNDYQICFDSFPNAGKEFIPNAKNTNIKTATYDVITSANLTYYINNFNFEKNKIFYTVRFDQKILEKINMPKMIMAIYFINSQRQQELININNWYFQNNYYYAPFFVPKSNYTEKFTQIIFSISFEFKQALTKKEILKFDLELIESQEITCECNINILPNKEKEEGKNKLLYPKVHYINIQKNIFEFDRDILLLKQDPDNKYITPFFSSNINIDKNNANYIQKNLIDINKNTFLTDKNTEVKNTNNQLLLFILDESCNEIKENENIFISFKFYGGYQDLMHYQEGITVQKFFNEDKNKILIKMPNCRPQYFFNYFNQKNENIKDERILDIESSLGNMNLFYMNQIKGKNLDEYFSNLGQNCVHKFENSILSGNFAALEVFCSDNKPVLSYIYAHKKNLKEDFINFMNQKALIYIEYNTQYSLKFNAQEKENEFNFRIKILRTNVKEEDYKIDITYENEIINLDKENNYQILKHAKNSESNIVLKINSNSNNAESANKNKGFILEIFKGIDIEENNILFVEKETEKEKEDLKANELVVFLYGKKEINSANNKIELLNDSQDKTAKIKICVHSGKSKYPFILKPLCNDEEEYIIINPGETFTLNYNNPYTDGTFDENEQFYVTLCADKNLKYSYIYEREINLAENVYGDINLKGKKIFKISNQKGNKKSIYYQINVCENKNSEFNYIINN